MEPKTALPLPPGQSAEDDIEPSWTSKWGPLFLLLGAVIGVWCFYGGHTTAMGTSPNKFDALDSLFGGLAFAGLLFTLLLQSKDLSLQRKMLGAQKVELSLMQQELKITADATKQMAQAAVDSLTQDKFVYALNTIGTLIREYTEAEKSAQANVVAADTALRHFQAKYSPHDLDNMYKKEYQQLLKKHTDAGIYLKEVQKNLEELDERKVSILEQMQQSIEG